MRAALSWKVVWANLKKFIESFLLRFDIGTVRGLLLLNGCGALYRMEMTTEAMEKGKSNFRVAQDVGKTNNRNI